MARAARTKSPLAQMRNLVGPVLALAVLGPVDCGQNSLLEKCWPEGASRRKLAELLHWIEAELEVILHERELDKPAGNT